MRKKKSVEHKPWLFEGKEIKGLDDCPENSCGFIYLITNNEIGKKYVGKKSLYSYKSKIVHKLNEKTGRMNKVKEVVAKESDWQSYFGSNIDIKQAVKEFGTVNFTREILKFCYSKKELTFRELEEQCKREVLDSEDYYNDNILGKFFKFEFNRKKC